MNRLNSLLLSMSITATLSGCMDEECGLDPGYPSCAKSTNPATPGVTDPSPLENVMPDFSGVKATEARTGSYPAYWIGSWGDVNKQVISLLYDRSRTPTTPLGCFELNFKNQALPAQSDLYTEHGLSVRSASSNDKLFFGTPTADNGVVLRMRTGCARAPEGEIITNIDFLTAISVDRARQLLAVVLGGGLYYYWIANTFNGQTMRYSVPNLSSPKLVAVGRLSHSMYPDIVVYTDAKQISLLSGASVDDYKKTIDIQLADVPAVLQVGDLNGDGLDDIVYSVGKTIKMLINDKNNPGKKFLLATAAIDAEFDVESLTIGDVDGDRNGDISISNHTQSRILTYINKL